MKHYLNTDRRGFTLVEIMIVVVILGMLLTMALPSFQDQAIRIQVREAMNLSEFAMDRIETYYRESGKLPPDNLTAGLPEADKIVGNYVEMLEVKDGAIHVTLGQKVNRHVFHQVLSLRPAIVADEPQVPIAWVMGFSAVPNGMEVKGENQTNVLSRHLPMSACYVAILDEPVQPLDPGAEQRRKLEEARERREQRQNETSQ